MSKLVFIDTETTSLRPDRRAWEIGLIVREPDCDEEYRWFVDIHDLDLGNADLGSLKIGGFYERHPQVDKPLEWQKSLDEEFVLAHVEKLTRGAHLVGAVPNFDTDVLGTRMRERGILPSWHYHLIDIEALMVGYLRGQNGFRKPSDPTAEGVAEVIGLPWSSYELSLAVGVEPPNETDRHTALGDARWARDVYDAVMGVSS